MPVLIIYVTVCDAAGLDPSTTRHTLRHAFGTALADVGPAEARVGVVLGGRPHFGLN